LKNFNFVNPNPQAGSELVFSIVQPLLRGGGYAYNRARLKVAQLEVGLGTAEHLRSLETHLIEVRKARHREVASVQGVISPESRCWWW